MNNDNSLKFSVVIPLYNEEDNVEILHKELISALKNYDYELIYVNDGSTDSTYYKIKKEIETSVHSYVKIMNICKNLGQTQALKVGLDNARFPLIIFIDGDLQNDPKDIPRLIEKIEEGYDLVQGVRFERKDPFFKKILPAMIANFILRSLCGSKFKDIGCALKAFKKDLTSEVNFYQGMHRMLPLYLQIQGANVVEIKVNHRKRCYGQTKYGFSRIFPVSLEIIKIFFKRIKMKKFNKT